MLKYDQPDFYKFNQDSIELVNFALSSLSGKPISEILDIGCGCGVMGIEYSLKKDGNVDFLELQPEFIPFIEENIKKFNIQNASVINSDLFDFNTVKKYNLILVNPPYYTFEDSRKSLNENKNICRLMTKEAIRGFVEKVYLLMSDASYLAICFPVLNTDWQKAIDNLNLLTINTQTVGRVKYLILKNIQSL